MKESLKKIHEALRKAYPAEQRMSISFEKNDAVSITMDNLWTRWFPHLEQAAAYLEKPPEPTIDELQQIVVKGLQSQSALVATEGESALNELVKRAKGNS